MIGIIIVGHGSTRQESNDAFLEIVERFSKRGKYSIVEPAHMELAPPTISEAVDKCVKRGATEIIVHPYFLLPGKHGTIDIPRMVGEAAAKHPGIKWKVTETLGQSDLLLEVIAERIEAARTEEE